ncbi:metal ABC transporter ATP-binding protein [Desulforudis sp. 1088]|uniref:metal ABC transporter ATP-binding protein n=2 Tax=Candidatus Desulforudis TaxID=471826 RepID=UPI003498B93C
MELPVISEPVVEFKNVSVTAGGRFILDRINFAVDKGVFLAIVGPNGAGKTTLIRALLGLMPVHSGEILLFGAPPAGRNNHRHMVGYLPQRHRFDARFPVSALDVAVMGRVACIGLFRFPGRKDRETASATLQRMGLPPELQSRPIGELSGGQQQLALLARAMCSHTRLLILDEPTTGLDLIAQRRFYKVVEDLRREFNLTVIVVSHDIAAVSRYANRFLCLNRGRILEGLPPEFRAEIAAVLR